MSILGKLLIVLNLLAAGAFAYFTLENYKARRTLTTRALERSVALGGLPVEARGPAESDSDRVAFRYDAEGHIIETIARKDLAKILPPGGDPWGNTENEVVADQTAEVNRVKKKTLATVPAMGDNPVQRFGTLKIYLLNLARTGAERDGVNALFDLGVKERSGLARRDLPLLGRTSSQQAALQAMVAVAELEDPEKIAPANVQASRVGAAREAIKQLLLGEVPHGVAGGDQEGERKLQNAILNAFEGKGAKEEIERSATANPTGFKLLADAAAEPLTNKPSADRAIKAMLDYAVGKAVTPTETAALTALGNLINPPLGVNQNQTIDTVATNLLEHKFDEAALPALAASGPAGKETNSVGEKARRVAHLLYHIDAHRHGLRDEATVAARKAWHERVATVVGLQEYVRAAEEQASEYADASSRLLAAITEEQSSFEAEYQAQIQRVQFLFTQWLTQEAAYKAQEAVTKENEQLRAQRETERNRLKDELASSIESAKVALTKLLDTQKQLRDAQAALLTLEQELRRLELRDTTTAK